MADLTPEDKHLIEVLKAQGAPEQVLEQVKQQDNDFGVFSCIATALDAFLKVQTQWRPDGSGIDYTAANTAWQLAQLDITPAEFAKIQTLEMATIDAIREQHEQV